MGAYQDKFGRWRWRKVVTVGGQKFRISGTSGPENTRESALDREAQGIARAERFGIGAVACAGGRPPSPAQQRYSTANNNYGPSTDGVYAIQCQTTGLIKIGRGHIPSSCKDLQNNSPVPLVLVGYALDPSLEGILHSVLAGHRRHGEWFDDCEKVRSAISGFMTEVSVPLLTNDKAISPTPEHLSVDRRRVG